MNTFVKYIFIVLLVNSYANSMERFFGPSESFPRYVSPSTARIVFKEGVCEYNYSSQLFSLEETQASFGADKRSIVELLICPNCQKNGENLHRFLEGVAHNQEKYGNPHSLSLKGDVIYKEAQPPNIHMNIINSITNLIYLEVLTLQGLVVDFLEPSWSNLVNLRQLTLTNISFFGEEISNLFSKRLKKDENYDDLKFKAFAIGLSNFPKLEVLDLSDNDFFPHPPAKIKKGKEKYKDWCVSHVGECAALLGLNFRGHTLKMRENTLGPIFLNSFSISLENNRTLKEIDFSNNSFRVDEAARFIISIHRSYTIKIHIYNNLFEEKELKAELVEQLLPNVNLQL